MDGVVDPSKIRNFSIISHIDHGKSTLSDRILELTGAVDPREMREQFLDSMDIERERGITIKAQNVRVTWRGHVLQLIDTPGHVDFSYEVSRSLAACEGVILLVDASQGIQAQTLANCYLAMEDELEIVAALNKIDLPAADPDRYAEEIERVLGIGRDSVLRISAKTGEGVPELLDAVVERVPSPKADPEALLRALVFDSYYDQYRGVVSSIRLVDGTLRARTRVRFVQAKVSHDVEEIGVRLPSPTPVEALGPGEVGYLIAGVKAIGEARVGETVTDASRPAPEPLPGYQDPKPMVFCGLYPIDGDEFPELRDALERLKLNDASITYAPETSAALGFGFRCGFLGLLHMDIVRERLEREFGLSLIATAPSVGYVAHLTDGEELLVDNPSALPEPQRIDHIDEPMLLVTIVTPAEYVGTILELCQQKRGRQEDAVPVGRPARARVHASFGGDRHRLLRSAEEPDEGVREPRLRAGRSRDRQPRQSRHRVERPACRRFLVDRVPRAAPRMRAANDREASRAHSAPAFRRPDPGGDRRPNHRA